MMLREAFFTSTLLSLITSSFFSLPLHGAAIIAEKVEVSETHACVLTQTSIGQDRKELHCWGNNLWGQLGQLKEAHHFTGMFRFPVAAKLVRFETGDPKVFVRTFATASRSTCAILSDNSIRCQGHIEERTNKRDKQFRLKNDIPIEIYGAKEYDNSYCVTTDSERLYCWTDDTGFNPHLLKMGKKVLSVSLAGFEDRSTDKKAVSFLELCAVLEGGAVKCANGFSPYYIDEKKHLVEHYRSSMTFDSIRNNKTPIDLSSEKLEIKFPSGAKSVTIDNYSGKCFLLNNGKVECFTPRIIERSPPPPGAPISNWYETFGGPRFDLGPDSKRYVEQAPKFGQQDKLGYNNNYSVAIDEIAHFTIQSKEDRIKDIYLRGYAGICTLIESDQFQYLKCLKPLNFTGETSKEEADLLFEKHTLEAKGADWFDQVPDSQFPLPLKSFSSGGFDRRGGTVFREVARTHCAIFINNGLVCWGANHHGLVDPTHPEEKFISVEESYNIRLFR